MVTSILPRSSEARQLAPIQQIIRETVPGASCTLSADCKKLRCGACDNLFLGVKLDPYKLSHAEIHRQAKQLAKKIEDAENERLPRKAQVTW